MTLAVVAFATAGAVAIVRPSWPSLGRTAIVRDLFRDPVVAVLGALVLAEVGYLLALALFTPPTEYDVLTYHLTRAVLWIQQGSVGPIPGVRDTRINDLPPNAELVQGMTVLLSRSLRWAGLVQMAALGVSVLAVYGIASRIGFDRRGAAFGALVFATLPVVAMQAPTSLNDVVVAALVATTVFFVLGRSRADLALACVSAAVLVGTKVTAFIAAPVIVAIAVLVHRGRRLAALLVGGMAAAVVGGAWYAVNLDQGTGPLGATESWSVPRMGSCASSRGRRATRWSQSRLPGPSVGTATSISSGPPVIALVVWLLRGRWSTAVVAGCLAALPVLTLRAEHGLHRVYWNGWELVGFDEATLYGTIRDPTVASNLQSWYGPLGVSLCVAASIVVTRRAYRGNLPWVAAILSVAPVALLLGVAIATGYNPFSGRYVMGGVALSAATWGFVRLMPAVAWAVVAVAATTLVLTLADFDGTSSGRRTARGRTARLCLDASPRLGPEHQAGARPRDIVRRRQRVAWHDDRGDARPGGLPRRLRRLAHDRPPDRLRGHARRGDDGWCELGPASGHCAMRARLAARTPLPAMGSVAPRPRCPLQPRVGCRAWRPRFRS